jgi:Tfp pilus assembly protein PilF
MMKAAGGLLVGLLLALCVSFCLTRTAEVDPHWHLLAGKVILARHQVPRVDDFTYTSAGNSWVDLQWLFETLLAWIEKTGGWAGLDLLRMVILTCGFACALAAARRRASSLAVAAVGLPALLAAQERFTLRPESISFLFLGVLMVLLTRRHDHPLGLYAAIPLMALWANMHALYVVGLAALLLVTVGDALQDFRPPAAVSSPNTRHTSRLALTTAAAAAATCLTPYGLLGWKLPWRLLVERIGSDNIYSRSIAEFQAPFGSNRPTVSILAFALLAVLLAATLLLQGRRTPIADLLLVGAFLALALMARRNIPLFALVALPVGAAALQGVFCRGVSAWPRLGRHAGVARWIAALVLAAAIAALLPDVWSNRFYERDGIQRSFGIGLAPDRYPEAAADFLLRHPPAGQVLNSLVDGGYLAWRWYPKRRVFIDGRLEVHDESLYRDYLRLQRDPVVFEEVARRYDIEAVVWPHQQSAQAATLLRYLVRAHDWSLVQIDLTAAVFARDPRAREVASAPIGPALDPCDPALEKSLLDEALDPGRGGRRGDPAPAWLRRVLPRRSIPSGAVNAAIFLGVVGCDAGAGSLFRAALTMRPDDAALLYDLGLVLDREGRVAEAAQAYRDALRADAAFTPAREGLALQAVKEGKDDLALREWRRAEQSGDLGVASLVARGRLLAGRGLLLEAMADYRKAVLLIPERVDLRIDLVLLYLQSGLRGQAAAELRRAAAIDADDPLLFYARAVLRLASGETDAALEAIQEGVRRGLDPRRLHDDPAFRILMQRPEFKAILGAGAVPEGKAVP